MKTSLLDDFEDSVRHFQHSSYTLTNPEKDIYKISNGMVSAPSIAFIGVTHGDEVIGLPILTKLLSLIQKDQLSYSGDIYLIFANRDAYFKNERYGDHDLNRLYGQEKIISESSESKRVEEIKKVLDHCDYAIDFHQTIEKTKTPFFIIPHHEKTYSVVKEISGDIPLILRDKTQGITVLSSYMAAQNKVGFTLEVGSYGVDDQQINTGINVVVRMMKYISSPHQTDYASHLYRFLYFQPYSSGEVKFERDFVNLEFIKKNTQIAKINGEPILSPHDGYILLYPQKWFAKESPIKADGLFFLVEPSTFEKEQKIIASSS